MSTDLISLVAAATVGAVLSSGGILLNQHLANRQDRARRQLEREREDVARSYERRMDAYVDFFMEFHRLANAYEDASAKGKFEPPDDYLVPLYDRVVLIQIFGTKEAAKLAAKAFEDLSEDVFHGDDISPRAIDLLRSEVRRDLKIPDGSDDLGSGSQ